MYSFPNLEPVHCYMSSSNLLLDLRSDFSGGRSGGLVFPSLEEFSTVCCDPYSQRFWRSQYHRYRCFSELPCVFNDPTYVCNLTSGSSAFSKTSLNIWKFTVHILLMSGLENFEHYFASVWDECNCAIVWAFFCIAFLWDWKENWPFPGQIRKLTFPDMTHSSLKTNLFGNSFPQSYLTLQVLDLHERL